ncbi:serine protease [Pseudohalocynthiibacter sp. F2068]|uniref:S1 family peptidase n=1 Tax=Pseudohalocynthiibacter sp. F2068 TaxID=2926418 RepID=UPI001FF49E79|nr:serine protease [Pseudohalocynthiibacter sp. F2068]MCK0101976.1 serine protease [Pseudohalocynthiibacter sp. F2068]
MMNELFRVVNEQALELKSDLPSFTKCNFKIGLDENVCITTIQFKESGLPAGGSMDEDEFTDLRNSVGNAREYSELCQIQALSDRFGWDRVLIVADVENETIDWHQVHRDLISWANDKPLPRARRINENRVKMALPAPPQYSLKDVEAAMWVLECDEACIQGTAFDLEGFGTITNNHVVSGTFNLRAFRADDVSQKYPVTIKKSNSVLDLAVIEIEGASVSGALKPSNRDLNQMDHAAVCGFPNYNRGDSGILSPGVIVGTRMKSGVRRLLTNAGIVSGMSGGPAIAQDNRVIGICVTGSNYMQKSRETEDQSIIPVSALELLE